MASQESSGTRRDHASIAFLASTWMLLFGFALLKPASNLRLWLQSGAALASLLILDRTFVFPASRTWLSLLLVNSLHGITVSSSVLHAVFILACWSVILVLSITRYAFLSSLSRRTARKMLRRFYFQNDEVAWLNPPALEVDVLSLGWFSFGGITYSIFPWTVEILSLELDLQLTSDRHVTIHIEKIRFRIFRDIHVSPVYAVMRSGSVSIVRSAPPDTTTASIPSDRDARAEYTANLRKVLDRCPVAKSRRENESSKGPSYEPFEKHRLDDVSIATALRYKEIPSHRPWGSVRLSAILQILRHPVVKFVFRIPYLLRLVLFATTHCHSLHIESICASIPGSWIEDDVLKLPMFESDFDPEVTDLKNTLREWLSGSDLHVQFVTADGSIQVPIRSAYDTRAHLRAARALVSRADWKQTKTPAQVVNVSGVDLRLQMSSSVLPDSKTILTHSAPGSTPNFQQPDTVSITFGGHASLPATIDRDLVHFAGELIKFSKWTELEGEEEEEVEEEEEERKGAEDERRSNRIKAGFESLSNSIRQKAKHNAEKIIKSGADHDWPIKMAAKLASTLESTRGDLGYTRTINVPVPKLR